ncbi:ACP reductase [Hyphodiscus hymeniophilus]|uniref:3-oxoacyl-[acyl-carrier-protein] reductase n=1 Tax=Hyphodiscus hymeniophilus TaxID=353542 RepID=A0A9P6SMJ5_9HELO|nr:ACP reductase [Hyphodiscus hymeniophilus]
MSVLSTDLRAHLALVTGASGGIGKATCRALATLGCSIAVHYHSSQEVANALVEELRVTSTMGGPTILFNNAGLTLKIGIKSIDEISIEDFEHTWKANCGSAFLLTQLCLPEMEKSGWGRIIFCSSVAGFTGGVIGPHYASSKSALHGLIHWLAGAYSKSGITFNGVAPALIQETTMLPANNEDLAKKIPIGRLGFPEEIAETVMWMVKTGYVTNKVIAVDGGMFVQ